MNIAIAGFGVEGQENFVYWSKDPSNTITIVDEKDTGSFPDGIPTRLGPGVFERLHGFDMVIRTAGLAPYKIQTDGRVWSATNEFFARCSAPIIGVTGSKGKGTTASLIASILEAAGRKVWLVGNIGLPGLSVLADIKPEDIVVYELSSFQLWDIEASPHTAVVLFIEQEHLDVHRSMEEYVEAKAQITRYQTANDLLVYNADNQYSRAIAEGSTAVKVGYPSELTAHVKDGYFYNGEQRICPVGSLRIKGRHNQDNAIAAIDAVWRYVNDPAAIEAGLANFSGLPHRLAYVATVNDVEYYDDSIATTPASAIAALQSFKDKKKWIILGGSYKGSDFTELAEELLRHDVKAVLIGNEAERLAESLTKKGFAEFEIISEPISGQTIMQTIVSKVSAEATAGSVVLLSPAAASFGLFKNYTDRGDQFIAAIKALS